MLPNIKFCHNVFPAFIIFPFTLPFISRHYRLSSIFRQTFTDIFYPCKQVVWIQQTWNQWYFLFAFFSRHRLICQPERYILKIHIDLHEMGWWGRGRWAAIKSKKNNNNISLALHILETTQTLYFAYKNWLVPPVAWENIRVSTRDLGTHRKTPLWPFFSPWWHYSFFDIIVYALLFMSLFMYLRGFEPFTPLERLCDFAKFWCGKNSGCYRRLAQ